jgi:hypothetical protein
MELADTYKRMKTLGPWTLDYLDMQLTRAEAAEFVELLYGLEVVNRRLKQAYPQVRLLWDTDAV